MKAVLRLLLPLLVLFSCASPPPEEPWVSYELRGTVLELKPADQVAIIDHEDIGDWMGAMKMGFRVPDPAEFGKLREGAAITATVRAQGYESYHLEAIEVQPEE